MATSWDLPTWLVARQQTPAVFAPGTHSIWTEPHVARSMLEAHLDPTHDAASRRPEVIDRTVAWIASRLRKGARILDLGCGPGLYATRLARTGFDVTGVDWSEVSIDYARSQGSSARYLLGDYLRIELNETFDAVLMIYLDFGTFGPAAIRHLLDRVRAWLVPAGVFIFDVATPARRAGSEDRRDWRAVETGFWSSEPYLSLMRTLRYEEGPVYLDEHVVITASEERIYRVWERCYEPATIGAALAGAGFRVEGTYGDLEGAPYWPGASAALGVVARRR